MSDELPQFPNYPAPSLSAAPPGTHKPLMKLVKNLAKPMKARDPFHGRTRGRKKMKTVRFY